MANMDQNQTVSGTTDVPRAKFHVAQYQFRTSLNKLAPDNQSLEAVPTASTTQFCSDLDAVFVRCSPENIQVSTYIAPHPGSLSLDMFFTGFIEMQRMDSAKHSPIHDACGLAW
jgi:hypothetical protein